MVAKTSSFFLYITQTISNVNDKVVSQDQKVAKFEILPSGFSRKTGEQGPLYKIHRRFIIHRVSFLFLFLFLHKDAVTWLLSLFINSQYNSVIDRMYAGEQVEDYESAEWYHGPISRQEVEGLLKVGPTKKKCALTSTTSLSHT